MTARVVGPQDDCVQCGESKATIRTAQRRGGLHTLFCAIVDYFGECEAEWDRHRFIWTQADADAQAQADARDEAMAFTMCHPIGTPVVAYPGFRPDDPKPGTASLARALTTRVRSVAWVAGGTAIVKVDGHPGGIALSHIDVIEGGDE